MRNEEELIKRKNLIENELNKIAINENISEMEADLYLNLRSQFMTLKWALDSNDGELK